MRALLIALLLIASSAAAEVTRFDDPAGDAETSGAPPVVGDPVDIIEAFLEVTDGHVVGSVVVADLESVHDTDVGVFPDTMFIVRWTVEDGDRPGEWRVRGDYQPEQVPAWSYWAEGPCLDGNDTDGCAGSDRDIIKDLEGEADLDNDTVSIRLPVSYLGDLPDQVWGGFYASAHAVWPTYPVYTSDWAYAPEGEAHTFAPEATAPEGDGAGQDETGEQQEQAEGGQDDEQDDEKSDGRSADDAEDAKTDRAAPAAAPADVSGNESPGVAPWLALAAGLVLARRRS